MAGKKGESGSDRCDQKRQTGKRAGNKNKNSSMSSFAATPSDVRTRITHSIRLGGLSVPDRDPGGAVPTAEQWVERSLAQIRLTRLEKAHERALDLGKPRPNAAAKMRCIQLAALVGFDHTGMDVA